MGINEKMETVNTTKRMTISDIARLAGVAPSTVSEVVNNDPKSRVSRKTFDKVRKVIDKYNYVPSPQARALITNKTRQIGYLVSATATLGLANNYFSMILAGIERACAERDYRCLVNRYDLSSLEKFVMPSKFRQRSVDALIIAGYPGESPEMLKSLNIPIAVIGLTNDEQFFQLSRDTVKSYIEIFRYLAREGHRKVLLPYLGNVEHQELERAIDICNGGQETPLTPMFVTSNSPEDEFKHGADLAELVLNDARYQDCTALAANDQICRGFMCRMHRHGKRFPDDFSVVSNNDGPMCEWNTIPITACGTRTAEHGYIMGNLMVDLLEELKTPNQIKEELRKLFLPEPFIIRESSGKAPKINLK